MRQKILVAITACALILVIGAMPELLPLVDAAGIEMVATFVLYYLKSTIAVAMHRLRVFASDLIATLHLLACTVMFKPRNYALHATTSIVVFAFTGSTLLSCALWLPVFAMSGGPVGI